MPPATAPKVILAARVPPALKRKIEAAAKHDHRTISSWVEKVCAEALEKGRSK